MDVLDMPILVPGPVPDFDRVEVAVVEAVYRSLDDAEQPGILLSAGVDSSLMARVVSGRRLIPTFTVANRDDHPDLVAAQRLAEEWGLHHHTLVVDEETRRKTQEDIAGRPAVFPGDDGVFLACRFAADHGVKTLLATDGIDELVGGYWWHANLGDRFGSSQEAFEYYWSVLWPEHLDPLLLSGEACGVKILFPYLDRQLVSTLTRVPLERRVVNRTPKAYWKAFAAWMGVPLWVIERPKLGFVAALQWAGADNQGTRVTGQGTEADTQSVCDCHA